MARPDSGSASKSILKSRGAESPDLISKNDGTTPLTLSSYSEIPNIQCAVRPSDQLNRVIYAGGPGAGTVNRNSFSERYLVEAFASCRE